MSSSISSSPITAHSSGYSSGGGTAGFGHSESTADSQIWTDDDQDEQFNAVNDYFGDIEWWMNKRQQRRAKHHAVEETRDPHGYKDRAFKSLILEAMVRIGSLVPLGTDAKVKTRVQALLIRAGCSDAKHQAYVMDWITSCYGREPTDEEEEIFYDNAGDW